MIEKRYKVLRHGVSMKRDDGGFGEQKVGATISLSDVAAQHLMSEDPPYVEEVSTATKAMKEKDDA